MSKVDELQEQCREGLRDGLYSHEVIDHLVTNEDLSQDDARRMVFHVARELSGQSRRRVGDFRG